MLQTELPAEKYQNNSRNHPLETLVIILIGSSKYLNPQSHPNPYIPLPSTVIPPLRIMMETDISSS